MHSKIQAVAYNDKILDIRNYNPLYKYILKENKNRIDNAKQLFSVILYIKLLIIFK